MCRWKIGGGDSSNAIYSSGGSTGGIYSDSGGGKRREREVRKKVKSRHLHLWWSVHHKCLTFSLGGSSIMDTLPFFKKFRLKF